MNNSKTALLVLLAAFLSGCGLYYTPAVPLVGHFYLNPARPISSVGKVAVIELENYSPHPQISADFTEAISQALAKRHLFGLEVIYHADAVYNRLQLGQSEAFDLDRLAEIRKALKADAILVGSVTQYQPYPRMSVGIRIKLIDLRDGALLWAVQQVWDSSDKALAARMKRFFRTRMRAGYEPLKWELAIVSPRHFRNFVVYEIAATLP